MPDAMGADTPLSETRDDHILVRGHDLTGLIGKVSFTEMLLLELHGALPTSQHTRMIDAILVALMEHGLTPSALSTRLVLDAAPESLSGAIAAGLLAVGSRFLGTVEDVARLVQAIAAGPDGATDLEASREVRAVLARGGRVPGLGHNLHQQYDPRVAVLLRQAEALGVAGRHVRALHALERATADIMGRTLLANAAGVVGAVLSDLGYPPEQVRGFAVVARCAGLFAHVVDEQRRPIARALWEQAHAVPRASPPDEPAPQ
jgi:citrate synthase